MTQIDNPIYVALGDSMSMDEYPIRDVDETYKGGTVITGHGVGAASLLHTNVDQLWPEFAGRDLTSRVPGLELLDLTVDGATTEQVLGGQLPRLMGLDPQRIRLVTLTVGDEFSGELAQFVAGEVSISDDDDDDADGDDD